ncbi:MAG: DUF2934 domain-containing protein [Candidatus Binatia bacterium]
MICREREGRGNSEPTPDHIAQRAFELFLARGATHGQDVEDWLRAERQLRSTESGDRE